MKHQHKATPQPQDFYAVGHGNLTTITPLSRRATDFLTENVQAEAWQWLGHTLAIDARCAPEIIHAMLAAGMRGVQ